MPKDNEVDEKVIEPVAVIYPDTGLRNDAAAMALWRNHGYDTGGEPLYSAATVAELRAEVAENEAVINVWRRRCDAAERRVGELEGEIEDLKAQLAREEHSHCQTIDARDRAEEALGDMFTAATGRPAEWSSAWDYPDAVEEVKDQMDVTRLTGTREK